MMNSVHGWMTDGGGVVEMEEEGGAENGGRDGNAHTRCQGGSLQSKKY